jgi:hypothetical protein
MVRRITLKNQRIAFDKEAASDSPPIVRIEYRLWCRGDGSNRVLINGSNRVLINGVAHFALINSAFLKSSGGGIAAMTPPVITKNAKQTKPARNDGGDGGMRDSTTMTLTR